MYCEQNFKTKKAMKEAVKASLLMSNAPAVYTYQPGGFPGQTEGEVTIEGPHYPEPHRWYARVLLSQGRIVKVLP